MKTYDLDAVEYIAKLADGGLRDSLSLLDKCLSYSTELTLDNVVKALGIADYETMKSLTLNCCINASDHIIEIIEKLHSDGKDLKQFIRQYINFVLDIKKYLILGNFDYLQIPQTDDNISFLKSIERNDYWNKICDLLDLLIKINADIKYDSSSKYLIEAMLLEEVEK